MTPPTPATSRPAIWMLQEAAKAMATLPASISSRAPSTVALSPNLCPTAPPGSASATPGTKYSPISTPISAMLTPNSLESSGATAATLWNWNAMVARTANKTARMPQRLRNVSLPAGCRRNLGQRDKAVNRGGHLWRQCRDWHRRAVHIGFFRPRNSNQQSPKGRGGYCMEQIRVCTYDGPGAQPVIRSVPWPKIPKKAALIKVGACGVCGTDLHILKGHWPKQLPWPFTLGHEIGGVLVEVGSEFSEDFMNKKLSVGSKVMIPPLMPCGHCYYCIHYPESANKCLTPVYYGRYLGFDKAPHLWGGWAEYVYVDLEMLPGTKIYKLPDDMSLRLGALSEPLTSCIRAFNRATRSGGFKWGDTVVIQGAGPIGILAVAAAQEMGAGRVICVGAPETPRLALARKFGAEATVNIEEVTTPEARIKAVRDIVGGFGADLVMDCSGHPSAGPEGIEMLRDGGTYVEMGQFTDAGSIETSWHRICTKDLNVLGSWGFTGNDLPLGVDMLYRTREKYPWLEMQAIYPFTEEGIGRAVADAMAMKTVKSTIVPWPELAE